LSDQRKMQWYIILGYLFDGLMVTWLDGWA
jgi:hypothetical protein